MRQRLKVLCRKSEAFENAVIYSFNDYCRETGAQLNLELQALSLPELHNGIMRGDFDVAHVNTDWLAQGWREGKLLDISSMIKENPPESYPIDYDRSMLTLQTFSDGVVGLPFHDGPECLIYRTDLFNNPAEREAYFLRYGKELVPPRTWDEFVQVASFFNRPQENLYGTLFSLYPDGHNNIFDFALQVFSRGGSLVDKRGHITLDTPIAYEALQFYRKLIRQPFIHPQSRNVESISGSLIFAKGEVAMMPNWFGFATMCETINESKTKGKVGVAAFPVVQEGIPPISLNVYYTWSISTQCRIKSVAYDFIRYATNKHCDVRLPMIGAVGCRKSTWNDPGVNAVIPYYHCMEEIHSVAKTLPRTPIWHAVSEAIDQMVLRVINSNDPIEDILDAAQTEINTMENGKISVEALVL